MFTGQYVSDINTHSFIHVIQPYSTQGGEKELRTDDVTVLNE